MGKTDILVSAIPFVIIALGAIIGRIRGFAGMIIQFAFTVVGLVFAREYASVFAEKVTEVIVHERLCDSISEKIISGLANGSSALGEIGLPKMIVESARISGLSVQDAITVENVNPISTMLAGAAESVFIIPAITCIAYMLIFIIARVIGRIFIRVSDLILKLPVIKQANEGLGAAVGTILGIFVAAFAVVAMVKVAEFIPETGFSSSVRSSGVISFLYEKILSVIQE